LCTGNGDVKLPFGHRYYVGLGFVVFSTLVLVEIFGSPYMRNIQVPMKVVDYIIVEFVLKSISWSLILVFKNIGLLYQDQNIAYRSKQDIILTFIE
jgi:xanthine/uracil permease